MVRKKFEHGALYNGFFRVISNEQDVMGMFDSFEIAMIELENLGWELVTIMEYNIENNINHLSYFKREVKSKGYSPDAINALNDIDNLINSSVLWI